MRSVACNLLRHIEFVATTTIEREVERDRDLGVGPSRQSQERLVITGSHDRPSKLTRIVPHICPIAGTLTLAQSKETLWSRLALF